MKKKIKATKNTAEKTETKAKQKELATRLGELTFERAKLMQHPVIRRLNQVSVECNQIATQMESL